jgi:hypothetical protein
MGLAVAIHHARTRPSPASGPRWPGASLSSMSPSFLLRDAFALASLESLDRVTVCSVVVASS